MTEKDLNTLNELKDTYKNLKNMLMQSPELDEIFELKKNIKKYENLIKDYEQYILKKDQN